MAYQDQPPIEQHYHVQHDIRQPPPQPPPKPPKTVLQVGMQGLSVVLSIGMTLFIAPVLFALTHSFFTNYMTETFSQELADAYPVVWLVLVWLGVFFALMTSFSTWITRRTTAKVIGRR